MSWFPDAMVSASSPGGLGMNVYIAGQSSASSTIVTGSFLTDAQLRASAISVTGSYLTDAQLRASDISVTGSYLTDAQLRASDISVTGSFLTDAQLRASDISVTGSFLTDAQLRASAVSVSLGYPLFSGSVLVTGSVRVTQGVGQALARAGVAEPWVTSPPQYEKTAFGEQRVSLPFTLLEVVNRYGFDDRVLASSVTLGGTVAANTTASLIELTVPATTGAAARIRSYDYIRYQPARGHRVVCSVVNEDLGKAGQVLRWGLFDDNDGLFWILSGTQLGSGYRSSTSGTPVDVVRYSQDFFVPGLTSASMPPFDIDISKGDLWEKDFEWLGVGNVDEFANGRYVNQFAFPGTLPLPYIKTAVLPFAVEIENVSAAVTGTFKFICCNVSSENGREPVLYPFAAASNLVTTTNATEIPILSIRLTQLLNGVDNRILVAPSFLDYYVQNNDDAIFRVRYNPTLTGDTVWTSISTYSGVEFNTNATAVSGGETLKGPIYIDGPFSAHEDLDNVFSTLAGGRRLGRHPFTGVSDVVTITVQRVGTGNPTVQVTLGWGEQR